MPKTKSKIATRAIQWLLHHRFLNLQSLGGYSGGGWGGGWFPGAILESFSGAWQQNVVVAPTPTLLSFSAVFACTTGIASDVAKMRVKLSRNDEGIWEEITANQPWLPLLRTPNHYQDRIQFFNSWMLSKLMYGNTYVLKQRDARGVVSSLYCLHPGCVKPLVSEDGGVYYELVRDDLSGIHESTIGELIRRYGRIAIPASEIIHDRMNTLWHPLVGVSPLYACGTTATMGSAIQSAATKFFQNKSLPGGMLTAPGEISDETAARLKENFETNFSGDNVGRMLVVGDGLEFKAFSVDAEKSQQFEQLNFAVEDVARAFRYPLWKLGGKMPPYTKPEQAQTMYYTDCLQVHIEAIELCLDNGLELPLGMGTEFDLDGLMRMDTEALYESLNKAEGWMKVDEQRFKGNYKPLDVGGDTVYKQHQDYSIEALAKRDAKADPFESNATTLQQPPATTPPAKEIAPAENRSLDYDLDEFAAEELRRSRRELTPV